jgi:YtkA-like
MSISTAKRALGVALTTLAFFGASSLARADINDYEFQLIQKEIKKGDAILSVLPVHPTDGKVVPDAVIFATRLDMAPDSMAEMQTTIAPAPIRS